MKRTLNFLFVVLLLAATSASAYSSRQHHSHSSHRSSGRHRSSARGYVFAKEVRQMRGGRMITIRPKHAQALRFKPKHHR